MKKQRYVALFTGFALFLVMFGPVTVLPAHAQTANAETISVSSQDINEQNRVVYEKIVETLRQYLKLVQLNAIQELEQRVAQLQYRIQRTK